MLEAKCHKILSLVFWEMYQNYMSLFLKYLKISSTGGRKINLFSFWIKFSFLFPLVDICFLIKKINQIKTVTSYIITSQVYHVIQCCCVIGFCCFKNKEKCCRYIFHLRVFDPVIVFFSRSALISFVVWSWPRCCVR